MLFKKVFGEEFHKINMAFFIFDAQNNKYLIHTLKFVTCLSSSLWDIIILSVSIKLIFYKNQHDIELYWF